MARTPEESAAAELRRAEIAKNVILVTKEDGDEASTTDDENKEAVEGAEAVEGEKETKEVVAETKETIAENKEVIADNKEQIENLEAEKDAALTEADKAKVQKRIDRLTASNKSLKDENADLKKQLAAKPEAGLTEEEVERRANEKAGALVYERAFNNDVNRLWEAAKKIDKNFSKNIDAIVEELGGLENGGIPIPMIAILSDIDNAADILIYFSQSENIDDYEEIRAFPPGKMGRRLEQLSAKLEAAKKAPVKEVKQLSKTPKPITPPSGSQSTAVIVTGKESMDDYVRKRQKMKEQRAEERKQGIRH